MGAADITIRDSSDASHPMLREEFVRPNLRLLRFIVRSPVSFLMFNPMDTADKWLTGQIPFRNLQDLWKSPDRSLRFAAIL
jgi:hypothetical protein